MEGGPVKGYLETTAGRLADDKRSSGTREDDWVYLHLPLYLEKLLRPEVQQAISRVVEDVEAMEAELVSYDFPIAYSTGSSRAKDSAQRV